jgi:hypothetical protein
METYAEDRMFEGQQMIEELKEVVQKAVIRIQEISW